ncbi:MAG: hypothetical protein GX620_12230 [Chloroflexi bacterium]|nr:hypothetical protein [Chloroflexota bacterium]
MRAALRWVASNLPLVVLALLLALLAWLVATEESDPSRSGDYPQPIPVTLTNLPDGMIVVGEFSQRVQVGLRTTSSVWNSLALDDFEVTADLNGLGVGVHEVPVQVTVRKEPVRLLSVEPSEVVVELERYSERVVPVRVKIEGEPPLGYLRRAATLEPLEATVSGPESYVSQVIELTTVVSVQDAISDVEGQYRLRAVDQDGRSVPSVELSPDVTTVRIPIELSGYYRQLAVKVVTEGQVAEGYRITGIAVTPPAVTVFGSPDVIAALPGFIETDPIDIEGAQANVIVRPTLSLTGNVGVVIGEQPVEVRVSVEPIESSQTIEIIPELQGMEPSFTATVSPESIQVILTGSLPLLENLQPDDVRVVLDLFGLEPGTHRIEPRVIVPEGLTAESILPPTVQVELADRTTQTPTGPSDAAE